MGEERCHSGYIILVVLGGDGQAFGSSPVSRASYHQRKPASAEGYRHIRGVRTDT